MEKFELYTFSDFCLLNESRLDEKISIFEKTPNIIKSLKSFADKIEEICASKEFDKIECLEPKEIITLKSIREKKKIKEKRLLGETIEIDDKNELIVDVFKIDLDRLSDSNRLSGYSLMLEEGKYYITCFIDTNSPETSRKSLLGVMLHEFNHIYDMIYTDIYDVRENYYKITDKMYGELDDSFAECMKKLEGKQDGKQIDLDELHRLYTKKESMFAKNAPEDFEKSFKRLYSKYSLDNNTVTELSYRIDVCMYILFNPTEFNSWIVDAVIAKLTDNDDSSIHALKNCIEYSINLLNKIIEEKKFGKIKESDKQFYDYVISYVGKRVEGMEKKEGFKDKSDFKKLKFFDDRLKKLYKSFNEKVEKNLELYKDILK